MWFIIGGITLVILIIIGAFVYKVVKAFVEWGEDSG